MTDLVTNEVPPPPPLSDSGSKTEDLTSEEKSDIGHVKPTNLVTSSINPHQKNFPKSSFTNYSPLTTRSRKITSPTSSFPFSPVSDTFSSSDVSDSATPVTTPSLGRKRTVSNTSYDERFPFAPTASMSRSSSTLSLCSNVSQAPSSLTPVERLLKHLRERMSGYLFSGWYTERRYVDAIDRYRDVILVDGVETMVIKQIKYAIRKCSKMLEPNSFVGLSFVDEECKLFINFGGGGLETTHPFGHYWFQIKSINFVTSLGLCLEIAVVRQFVSTDNQSCWKCKAREKQVDESPVKIDSISDAIMDMKTRVTAMSSEMIMDLWQPGQVWTNIRPLLTLSNVTQLGKLCLVLVLAMVTGIIAGAKQLAQFSLKLLHELANLVDRSTPLALAALNMVGKIVGGAYLLIAMIWRDAVKKPPVPAPTSRPALNMSSSLRDQPGGGSVQPQVLQRRMVGGGPGPVDHRAAMDHAYSQGRNW